MSDCIFCKIVAREIPCHKLYEDEDVLVFLDINPVSYGHLLVIPKKHYTNILDVTTEDLQKVILVAQKFANLVVNKLGATWINVVNASWKDAQQSVWHLHFHVVPRYPQDGIDLWFHGKWDSIDFIELKNRFID